MNIKALTLSVICLLLRCTVMAQGPRPLTIIGDSIAPPSVIFLGEVHDIYDGDAFKFQLMRWAYQRYGISNIVMEMGISDAYMFNQHFLTGDTTIFQISGHDSVAKRRLRQWDSLYHDTRCTIWGIDFERENYILASLMILDKHPAAQKTQFYACLKDLVNTIDGEDDEEHSKKHIHNYEKARATFINDSTQLKATLDSEYTTIARIMLNPATERKMKQRDKAMTQNLIDQLGDKPFICIVGAGHTHFESNTLLRRYLAARGSQGTLLINMLCKNCYNTSYYGTVLSPLAGDFNDKNEAYFTNICDQYCKPGQFTLISQHALPSFPSAFYPVTTYYALFKDQPNW